jgi:APA family basic amino acid/polyamine antiporter
MNKQESAAEPSLLRQLGVVSATALVVANMIGTGIFTTSGFLAADLGSPTIILWAWGVGAVCALIGAFCYSELGVNLPSSGGEYVYLTRAFGPMWGFLSGWVSFFAGFSAPIAAAALAFSDYLGYFFPWAKQQNAWFRLGSGDWTLSFGGAQIVASVLVTVFTTLNLFGVGRVARVQNALTIFKVLVMITFIILGLTVGTGNWAHLSEPAVRTSPNSVAAQFAISLFWIYVAYSGWNAATYVAEELKQPARTLPLALLIGTSLVAAIYLGLNLVFFYGARAEEMKGVVAVGALAASKLFGPGVAGVFSGLMAISLMSTVNAMVTIGPRVYYAMAKNGAFLRGAAEVHPKWHTPVYAILAQGVCTILLTATPFPQLVVYVGFTLNFFAAMAVVALMVFRRRRPEWQKLAVVNFLYPLVPLLFIAVSGWMIVEGFQKNPTISFAAVVTVLAGAVVYRLQHKDIVRT